jgi:hypothetical protein
VQHETDHLDGVLFIDRLDPAQLRKLAMKRHPGVGLGRRPDRIVQDQPTQHLRSGGVSAMRLVFAGTPEVAAAEPGGAGRVIATRSSAVVTRPDAVAGRGRRVTALVTCSVAGAGATAFRC